MTFKFGGLAMIFATLCAAVAAPASAQSDTFPAKPIRLVVPFTAGGGTDILGRLWAKKISELLLQPVVVENVGGAAGSVGAAVVARAPADGYTLLLGVSASNAIAPALNSQLRYDPVKDFAPVGQIATFGNAVIVHPSSPARNVRELVALAKRSPSGLSYGSWGIGSAGHLAVEMIKTNSGASFVHIPYKGTSQVLSDVMANQDPVGVTGVLEIEPASKAEKIRVIAVTGSKRAPNFPDVPTLTEQGVPFGTDSWFAVFVPAQTPAPVLAKLRNAFLKVRADAEFQKELVALGMNPSSLGADEFAVVQRNDVEVWSKLVKSSGAKAE